MTTFTLTTQHVQAIASLTNAAASDDMTPVIENVKLTITPAEWIATATDRYLAAIMRAPMGDHVHTLDMADNAEPLELLIHKRDLTALSKAMTSRKVHWALLTQDGTTITAQDENGAALAAFTLGTGNYPPIERLFPSDDAEHTSTIMSLAPARIAQLAKIMTPAMLAIKPAHRKNVPMHFRFTPTSNPAKPGPVLITRPLAKLDRAPGHDLRMLLQPNLVINQD